MACSDIRIRILVDNNVSTGLAEEHGFSALIEVSGNSILFDTGQGKALVPNAAILACDLRRVDTLILSHGHYDHVGAVSQVLQIAPTTRVFCHAGSLLTRYSIRSGEAPRTISMPISEMKAILDLPAYQVQWLTAPRQIFPDVGVTGPIPRTHPWEDTGGPFFLDAEGRYPDPMVDDMALWVNTSRGLIILLGCCHSGLVNTVEHIRSASGVERVFGIIGGLHLVNASRERLTATCSALRTWDTDFVVPCHCTGDEAMAFLNNELGSKVTQGYAGLELQPMV